jgi:hypothetical protein
MIGEPSEISAIFTVKSGLPLMNSLVPSSGSTRKNQRARRRRLFSDAGNIRKTMSQAREDHGLRPLVRFRHWRLIRLGVHLHARMKDVEDFRASL